MAITLRAARVNIGMTQTEAAKALGIGIATLQNYEAGKKYPNVLTLKKIEDLYGVPYAELIFLPENNALSTIGEG
jgi:transcriptional regulator with XRE-family HTH domain